MPSVLWVHKLNVDTNLDRTTWSGMASAMRNLGAEVTFIGACERHPAELPGAARTICVCRLPARRAWTRLPFFVFGVWLRVLFEAVAHGADWIILDVSTFICAFPLDLLAKLGLARVQVVLDLRTFDFGARSNVMTRRDRFWQGFTSLALRYGRALHAGLTVINKRLARRAVAMGGHRRVCIWGSGFTRPRPGEPPSDGPAVEAIRDLAARHWLVLYHGTLHENRGLSQAMEAVARARAQGAPVFFVLVGSGPAEGALRELLSRSPYASCGRLFPPVPHGAVYEIISLAQIGMMAYPDLEYWSYNHPIKLVEYLAMGKPVICTDIAMFRDAVANPDCLVWVPAAEPDMIAAALLDCVRRPDALARRSMLARQEAERLTWDRQAESLVDFLTGGSACASCW